jgi:hypothetical protein
MCVNGNPVVYMCDMVTLGGKDNGLEPRNHCVYRRTDGQPDSSIPPHNFVAGGIIRKGMECVFYYDIDLERNLCGRLCHTPQCVEDEQFTKI